jgi:L-ribulose-5-phosphate 4-epimerase
MLEELKKQVLQANLDLVKYGLVTLTWGNVSGINRSEGLIIIKPSGIDYDKISVDDMVTVDMNGKLVEGKWRPSSDTPTHIELYKEFTEIGGIAHSHSEYATSCALALKEIPCYGTTHADHFNGSIPVTRFLSEDEINTNYELYTGHVIVERFVNLNPNDIPGVLVAGHAPFAWGKNPDEAVKNNLVLEKLAKMAFNSLLLTKDLAELPGYILKKHFNRKHGSDAYYGQKNHKL